MEAATLKALNESIEKWERNAVAETPDGYVVGADDCALCDMFWETNCRGCPVMSKSGQKGCVCTPYVIASAARIAWANNPSDATLRAAAHAAARDEVTFLQSLLPEVGDDKAAGCGLPCGYDCNGACLF